MRKLFITTLLATIVSFCAHAQNDTLRHEVLIETSEGNIRVVLYNETPRHRDNFLRLVGEGFYDGIIWHRVIRDFMIQTGDSTTRHAQPGDYVGAHSPDYTIPAEIVYPRYYHKRGALAAARESDEVNPTHASSSSQFYIVYGKTFSSLDLDKWNARIQEQTHGLMNMTDEIRTCYRSKGGTPHLDTQYTVFGEVVEGMDVVKAIQRAETDDYDRPVYDIRILRATVVK